MFRVAVLAALFVSVAGGGPLLAQDTDVPQAQEREAGTYFKLFQFEFHPGKTDDALSVLYDVLVPAWRKAGVQVQVIESLLQTKDVLLLIELKDGPRTLAFSVPDQDARAWAALVQLAGNAEAANQAVDRFVGYLVRQSESLVFIRR